MLWCAKTNEINSLFPPNLLAGLCEKVKAPSTAAYILGLKDFLHMLCLWCLVIGFSVNA